MSFAVIEQYTAELMCLFMTSETSSVGYLFPTYNVKFT